MYRLSIHAHIAVRYSKWNIFICSTEKNPQRSHLSFQKQKLTTSNSQSQQFHLSIQNISQRMVNQSVQFDELKVEKHRKIGIILKESLKNSQL